MNYPEHDMLYGYWGLGYPIVDSSFYTGWLNREWKPGPSAQNSTQPGRRANQ